MNLIAVSFVIMTYIISHNLIEFFCLNEKGEKMQIYRAVGKAQLETLNYLISV